MTTAPHGTTQTGGSPSGSSGVREATQEARARAEDAFDKGREQVRGTVEEQVGRRSDETGERLGSVAEEVRYTSDRLRDNGDDTIARLVEQGAEQVERLADYLRGSNAQRILSDVEDYARRQPWAVAAGGAVVGFAASRLLRASRRDGRGDQSSWTSPGGRTGAVGYGDAGDHTGGLAGRTAGYATPDLSDAGRRASAYPAGYSADTDPSLLSDPIEEELRRDVGR